MSQPNRPKNALMDRLREASDSVKDIAASSADRVKESASNAADRLRDSVGTAGANVGVDVESLLPQRSGGREEMDSQRSMMEKAEEEVCGMLPSLTWQQRVVGCVSCMVVGYVVSFGSFIRFKDLLLGDPLPFVAVATIGNILSLSGSCFLTGPTNQVKRMFHQTRRVATILYIGSLVLTLVVAFAMTNIPGQGPLLLLLMVCQYVSIAWYCLSYIPFARQAIKRMCNRVVSELDDGGL